MEGLSDETPASAPANTDGSLGMGPSTASTASTAAAKATSTGTQSTTATPKLKDSCDMCAASKVRCDKRKPLCGRCKKLGYPCFFSPARRHGGRDRRREREREWEREPTTAPLASPRSQTSTLQTPPGARGEATDERRSSTSNSNSNSSAKGKAKGNETQAQMLMRLHRRTLPLATPQLPAPANSSTSNSTSTSTSSSLNDDASSFRNVTTPASSISLSLETDSATNASAKGAGGTAEPSDCITIATDTLLQLALAKHKHKLGLQAQDSHSHFSAAAKPDQPPRPAALETVAAAFRTLSSVLVCPCSELPTIGVLAAAVCLAMLDVYSTIISDSRADRHVQSPMADGSCMMLSMEDEQLLFGGGLDPSSFGHGAGASSSSRASASEDEDAAIVRVLAELTKVARVVMQFSKRYEEGDGEENGEAGKHLPRSPDYLIALAALLRSHMKSITIHAVV